MTVATPLSPAALRRTAEADRLARDRLVDTVWSDFFALEQSLVCGLDDLLARHHVSAALRLEVAAFTADLARDLVSVEAEVVKLANVSGAAEAGYRSLHANRVQPAQEIER